MANGPMSFDQKYNVIMLLDHVLYTTLPRYYITSARNFKRLLLLGTRSVGVSLYEHLRSHLATLELGSYTSLKCVALKVNN